jgi:hypothetical protein
MSKITFQVATHTFGSLDGSENFPAFFLDFRYQCGPREFFG